MTLNRLFPLHNYKNDQACLTTKMQDSAWLWHFCYGHLNSNGFKTLQKKNMTIGLYQISVPSKVCQDYVDGKQHRDSFPIGRAWRAKQPLQFIHSNICDLISPTSNNKKRYFISFINDYNRKTWVYFLQENNKVFDASKRLKAFVEKESRSDIKILHIHRGSEFNSHDFANFCAMYRICEQLTIAYTLQQNGVLERKNCMILNIV